MTDIASRVRRKWKKLKYSNPFSGLLFTLARSEYETQGCRFTFPRDRVRIRFRSQFFHDMYEDNERALVGKYLRPDDRVLELGAGIGVLACVTNRQLRRGKTAHVVVEANPYLIPYLYENRARNGAKFKIEHCAVAAEQDVTLFLGRDISRSSAHETTKTGVSVIANSLAALDAKDGPFDVLISDVQGSEIHVFSSPSAIPKTLRLVIVEWHPGIVGEEAIAQCQRVLEDCGFVCKGRSGDVEAWERSIT
jgi:FkbM family methyltransferase